MLKRKLLITVFLLILPLYFLSFNHFSLNDADESFYASISRGMAETNSWLTPHIDGKPFFHKTPLVFWMSAVFLKLFGINEISARLPAIILAILSIFLVFFISNKFYSDNTCAFFSCLVLLLSFQFLNFSHMLMMDIPAVFFALLAIYGLLRSEENKKWALLFGSGFGLSVLSKGMLGFILVACVIPYIFFSKKAVYLKNKYLWVGILIGTLFFLPWYIYETRLYGNVFLKMHFGEQIFKRSLSEMHSSGGLGIFFYPAQILINFFPWSVIFIFSFLNDLKNFFKKPSSMFLVSWILSYFVIITVMQTKLSHYCLPLYPFMAISVGNFLEEGYKSEIPEKSNKAVNTILLIFSSLIIFASLYAMYDPQYGIYLKYAKFSSILGIIFAVISAYYLLFATKKQNINKIWTKALFAATYIVLMGMIISFRIWDYNPDIKKLANKNGTEEVFCIIPKDRPDVSDAARFYFWHRLNGYSGEVNFKELFKNEKDAVFLINESSMNDVDKKTIKIIDDSGKWFLIKRVNG